MRTLWENEHALLELDDARGVVRFTRTSVSFPSLDAVRQTFDAITTAASSIDPSRYGLLIDLRQAVGRNDAGFEQITNDVRQRLTQRFARRATLVRTAAGKLQVQRIARESGEEAHVFDDPIAALEFLGSAHAPLRRAR
jgi:hypothetical protein